MEVVASVERESGGAQWVLEFGIGSGYPGCPLIKGGGTRVVRTGDLPLHAEGCRILADGEPERIRFQRNQGNLGRCKSGPSGDGYDRCRGGAECATKKARGGRIRLAGRHARTPYSLA